MHMRALWPRWTLLPAAPFVLWCLYCLGRGETRWELVILLFAIPALVYANAGTKRLFLGLLPFGLTGLLYDSMRFSKNVGLTPEGVHVLDLRAVELRWFGVTVDGVRMTLHDWFQVHHALAADVALAIPYGTFLYIPLLYGIYLYRREYRALQRFMWSFFAINVLGYATYHLYPAAPPWYFHAHGGNVDLAALASPGDALNRVDAFLGFHYFARLYGRSNDVFGAMPSLHVAYPLLMLFEVWRQHGAIGRALAVAFWLATCFAAVYLDHHWVCDVVAGFTLTCVVYAIARRFLPASEARSTRRATTERNTTVGVKDDAVVDV